MRHVPFVAFRAFRGYSSIWINLEVVRIFVIFLCFAFFFFAVVSCPWKFSRIATKFETVFAAFTAAEPENRAIIPYVHHARAVWKIVPAEGATF